MLSLEFMLRNYCIEGIFKKCNKIEGKERQIKKMQLDCKKNTLIKNVSAFT